MAKREVSICFYSPYIPTSFGGGEKHLFSIADAISDVASIYIALPKSPAHADRLFINTIQQKYERFLNKKLDYIHWIQTPLGSQANWLEKILWTKKFDYIFYVTDGSLFFSLAKHNIAHVQIPLALDKNSFLEKLKLKQWQHINVNSYFTKKVIERHWKVPVESVIYPEINISEFSPKTKKQKTIINVGRFFRHLHSKRQDICIELFKELYQANPKKMKEWKLVLVGSIEDSEYVSQLQKAAQGFPIEFYHDIDRKQLIELYNSASIFWHIAGYGIDQSKEPEKVEHFGISTIEAMAAGCVPLVVGKGGQIEVIGEDLKELLWQRKEELLEKTHEFIMMPQLLQEYKEKAITRSRFFNKSHFKSDVRQLFNL